MIGDVNYANNLLSITQRFVIADQGLNYIHIQASFTSNQLLQGKIFKDRRILKKIIRESMCNLGRVPFTGENEREPGENKNKSVVFDLP